MNFNMNSFVENRSTRKNKLPRHEVPSSLRKVVEKNMSPWPDMTSEHLSYLEFFRIVLQKEEFLKELETNYVIFFKTILFFEEVYNQNELRKYNMEFQRIGKRIYINEIYYEIKVEGLEDEAPNLNANDQIKLIDSDTREEWFFQVRHILKESVLVVPEVSILISNSRKFENEYRSTKFYDVVFMFNTYPYQCYHYALDRIQKFELVPCLFPKIKRTIAKIPSSQDMIWFNEGVKNNPEQRKAVINILNNSSGGLPYILYGPPGTGKTATIIEAACQAEKSSSCKRILICTPSNETADSLVKKLLSYFKKTDLFRLYSISKDPQTIDSDIIDCCNVKEEISWNGTSFTKKRSIIDVTQYAPESLPKVIITTLCTSTRLTLFKGVLNVNYFSYIFIDEAGQAMEPASIIPMTLLSSSRPEHKGKFHGQIVLAGDPQQLGPVAIPEVTKKILGVSFLERLLNYAPYRKNNDGYDERFITKLVKNYRSHHALISISNELFYDNELEACAGDHVYTGLAWKGLPNPKFPIVFKQTWGEEQRSEHSQSPYNEAEIRAVMNCVNDLTDKNLFIQNDIGIVTPFTSQKLRLKAMLKENRLEKIEVGTVQLFQGREKKVIIVSTVRSRSFIKSDGTRHLAFLSEAKRFNVTLTRAQNLLVVIGNPQVLEIDSNWDKFITYCYNNNAYSGSNITIKYASLNKKKKKQSKKSPFFQSAPKNNDKKEEKVCSIEKMESIDINTLHIDEKIRDKNIYINYKNK